MFCPVCNKSSSRFLEFGAVPRENARCPHCESLERHRLLWLYLTEKTDLLDGRPKKVLHVAPERCLLKKLEERLEDGYLTADLEDPNAMVKMDIMHIDYAEESFDVILCSHVLEHVPDDRKALREFHRVLKQDGWAILLVPITAKATFEDPSIVDPQERLRLFGQEDHVRRYGLDYLDRLREAGFHLQVLGIEGLASTERAVQMGLATGNREIYFCTKGRQPSP